MIANVVQDDIYRWDVLVELIQFIHHSNACKNIILFLTTFRHCLVKLLRVDVLIEHSFNGFDREDVESDDRCQHQQEFNWQRLKPQ